MKIALVIDDIGCLDFMRNGLLEDVEELDDYLGMKAYSGISKGQRITIYFFNSLKEHSQSKLQDLFSFEDLELIINVGYCFSSPEQNKVNDSDLLIIGSTKCDHSYRESLDGQNDSEAKRIFQLDKKLEKKVLDLADKLGIPLKIACCCSVTHLDDLEFLKDAKLRCGCFDQKAFAVYEGANRYNRNAICLYKAVDHTRLDLEHYLLEKPQNLLNDLVQIALEFEFRCRIK